MYNKQFMPPNELEELVNNYYKKNSVQTSSKELTNNSHQKMNAQPASNNFSRQPIISSQSFMTTEQALNEFNRFLQPQSVGNPTRNQSADNPRNYSSGNETRNQSADNPTRNLSFVNETMNYLTSNPTRNPSAGIEVRYAFSEPFVNSNKLNNLIDSLKRSGHNKYIKLINNLTDIHRRSRMQNRKELNKEKKYQILKKFYETRDENVIKNYILYLYIYILYSYIKDKNQLDRSINQLYTRLISKDQVFSNALHSLLGKYNHNSGTLLEKLKLFLNNIINDSNYINFDRSKFSPINQKAIENLSKIIFKDEKYLYNEQKKIETFQPKKNVKSLRFSRVYPNEKKKTNQDWVPYNYSLYKTPPQSSGKLPSRKIRFDIKPYKQYDPYKQKTKPRPQQSQYNTWIEYEYPPNSTSKHNSSKQKQQSSEKIQNPIKITQYYLPK
jgi:hypothetical protein